MAGSVSRKVSFLFLFEGGSAISAKVARTVYIGERSASEQSNFKVRCVAHTWRRPGRFARCALCAGAAEGYRDG